MRFSICAVALLLLGALPGGVRGAKRKKATDWNTVGWDDLEETWKDGDADDELITDDQLLYKEMERRREQGPPVCRSPPHPLRTPSLPPPAARPSRQLASSSSVRRRSSVVARVPPPLLLPPCRPRRSCPSSSFVVRSPDAA